MRRKGITWVVSSWALGTEGKAGLSTALSKNSGACSKMEGNLQRATPPNREGCKGKNREKSPILRETVGQEPPASKTSSIRGTLLARRKRKGDGTEQNQKKLADWGLVRSWEAPPS